MPESDEGWGVKSEFQLRAVFASRIAPMKNLLFLLEVLARCRGDIHLDIIGPPEDAAYWATCPGRDRAPAVQRERGIRGRDNASRSSATPVSV